MGLPVQKKQASYSALMDFRRSIADAREFQAMSASSRRIMVPELAFGRVPTVQKFIYDHNHVSRQAR